MTCAQALAPTQLDGLDVRQIRRRHPDRRAMRRALRGIERVFHVAGTTNLRIPRAELFAIAVEGTRIVLEEALRAGVERAVYTSSVAAIGPAPPGRTADERSAWRGGRYSIPYLDAMHEARADRPARSSPRGLPLVVVNPAHVLGPGDPGPVVDGRSSAASCAGRFPAYVDGTLNIVVGPGRRPRPPARRRARPHRRALHPRQPELHHDPAVRRSRPAVRRAAARRQAAVAGRAGRSPPPASASASRRCRLPPRSGPPR